VVKGTDYNGYNKAVRGVYRMSNKPPHTDLLPGSITPDYDLYRIGAMLI
jgi:hypothetical protein